MPDPVNTTGDIISPPQYPAQYPALWDWSRVERVLLVRLRSIGDAVLTTPCITALRRFLPDARIDILLEDWVAPVLDGFPETGEVDNVIVLPDEFIARIKLIKELRATRYDVIYNLHGGTTSSFVTYIVGAAGAAQRVGFGHYRYGSLYNHLSIPAAEFWGTVKIQSAEQQLAMLGWTGVPVGDRPPASLKITADADAKIAQKLKTAGIKEDENFALFHPAAAFTSKEWAAEKFARVAEYLAGKNISTVAVAAPGEEKVLEKVKNAASVPIHIFSDLSLPEITALTYRAKLFAGNDSGIAHIAAAVKTPCVVIFGSSNVDHWRPYTNSPNQVVTSEDGIDNIPVKAVIEAIEKL